MSMVPELQRELKELAVEMRNCHESARRGVKIDPSRMSELSARKRELSAMIGKELKRNRRGR